MGISFADTVGYFALAINLYSMSVKGESKLRSISTIANIIFIGYGLLLSALPIIIGSSIAVFLHVFRLKKMKTENRRSKRKDTRKIKTIKSQY